jgi:hypothetical protein
MLGTRTKRFLASIFSTALLSFAVAAPASAQPVGNIGVGNLVNVQITANNIANNNDIDVTVPVSAAVNIAANVCGVTVNVLAIDDDGDPDFGPVDCTNVQRAGSDITINP